MLSHFFWRLAQCKFLGYLEQLHCLVVVPAQVYPGAQSLDVESRPRGLAQDETSAKAGSLTYERTVLLTVSQMITSKLQRA